MDAGGVPELSGRSFGVGVSPSYTIYHQSDKRLRTNESDHRALSPFAFRLSMHSMLATQSPPVPYAPDAMLTFSDKTSSEMTRTDTPHPSHIEKSYPYRSWGYQAMIQNPLLLFTYSIASGFPHITLRHCDLTPIAVVSPQHSSPRPSSDPSSTSIPISQRQIL